MNTPFSSPHSKRALNQSLERRAHQQAEFKSRRCREPQGSKDFHGRHRPGKAGPCDKPCFVYILVHATEQRMKIGMSDTPKIRLNQLPEAGQIDRARSLQLELPNRQRASQVESSLHKALGEQRLELTWTHAAGLNGLSAGPRWDGATEWFHLRGLSSAIEILHALPGLSDEGSLQLQTLDGKPYWLEPGYETLTHAEWLRHDACRYNLNRIERICDVLTQINRCLKLRWRYSTVSSTHSGILRIQGFKRWWDPENLPPRMLVLTNELWALKTGKPAIQAAFQPPLQSTANQTVASVSPPDYVSLLTLIRYASDDPNDLELVFNISSRIRKLPAGLKIARRWALFREGLEA